MNLAELARQGWTLRQIAAATHYSTAAVHRKLQAAGGIAALRNVRCFSCGVLLIRARASTVTGHHACHRDACRNRFSHLTDTQQRRRSPAASRAGDRERAVAALRLLRSGLSQRTVAARLGFSRSAVQGIASGTRWRSLSEGTA